MNNVIEKAKELDQYNNNLPDVEVGGAITLAEIWDGTGEVPQESYSIQLTDNDWINYSFDVIEKNSDPLKTVIKIANIELL